MARIGKKPVSVNNVDVEYANQILKIKGPKGELTTKIPKRIDLDINTSEKLISLKPKYQDKYTLGLHGTIRSEVANMVEGVVNGFEKKLQFSGVGFRVAVSGDKLVLNLGFSHPIEIKTPEGIQFKVEKNIITISGINKYLVGEITSQIRKIYPPEPYKGKGIAYEGEIIKRKPGKAAAKAEGGE
ncbi:50S ribosomal protein L6 [Patescibacteria group bacterium]